MDAASFCAWCAGQGIGLTEPQVAAFAAFQESLYAAGSTTNLTRVPVERCAVLHFVDSLLFQDLIAEGSSVLDLGSGPGFPAWPLACARPDLSVTALDSSQKMLGFLRTVARPNLVCLLGRAETCGIREAFDFVTGRALAPLPIQLELSAGPCRIGGLVVPMRTPGDLGEIERMDPAGLGLRLRAVERRVLPEEEALRVFPIYEKVSATPAGFPRAWAQMKRRPFGS
jgi:16S rRNA (guanine527-N7)-methyltransferase